jgi:hypothetical protein
MDARYARTIERQRRGLIVSKFRRKTQMRMPVLRYFLVVGSVLFGLLILVNSKTESSGPAVKTAQTVGLPQSVKL